MNRKYMSETDFSALVRKTVAEYHNEHREENAPEIGAQDVYIVWMCRILQNNKALAATNQADGMYYELTYDGDRGQMYVDVYRKQENFTVVV